MNSFHNIFKIALRVTFLIFTNVLLILTIAAGAETFTRVRMLGYKNALQTIKKPFDQPTALGAADWAISDPDLNYRLNPARNDINEFSMPAPEITIPKPKGVIRIIILGDSLPYFGDPTFIEALQEIYRTNNKVEIFSAATPGYTTYQEVTYYKKFLNKLEPDLVLLSYCLNDNHRFLHRFDKNENMLWTEEAEKSLSVHNPFDALIVKSYFLSSIKLAFTGKQPQLKPSSYPWETDLTTHVAWKDHTWDEFHHLLRDLNDTVKSQNGKLFVVIFPLEVQLNPEFISSNFHYVTKPQRHVLSICQTLGLTCLDLFEPFSSLSQGGVKLYTDGLHFTTAGHTLAASEISTFLNRYFFAESKQ